MTNETAVAPAGGLEPARFADPESANAAVAAFDLRRLPPEFYANPYPTYHALRELAPVHRLPDGSIFLSRHADCVSVYKDALIFSSDKQREFKPKYGEKSLLYEHHTTSLVFNDPPLHTRVRKIIAGALTPRAIADMERPVTALVEGLLDAIAAKGGKADLIADLAAAVPVEVIGNLLAVPREERAPLRGWSLAILGALEPALTARQRQCGEDAVADFLDYLRILVAERRVHPGDPDHDVLTRLIQGEGGEKLSERELLHNIIFILNAGHETATNLIGNALVSLTEWPQERARLIANPSLIRAAIEEFLRFESSNQFGNRMTTVATELGGVRLPANTFITIGIGAANRDPAEFSDPDRLDLARSPNRHLAFGSGVHVCAGINVARLEGRIAIGRFVTRFPNYSLAGAPARGGRARFRGFLSIPVVV